MNPDRLWLAGEQSASRGDLRKAEQSYRQALALDGRHAPSLVGLSTVLSRLGRHLHAREAAMAAFEARPPAAPVIYAIAQRLRHFHESAALVTCLAEPAFRGAAPPDILARAAVMLSSIGAQSLATALVAEGLQRKSTDPACLHVMGNFHYFAGETKKARACYEASLEADPLLFQNSLMLAGLEHATPERNDIERLQSQLTRARPGGNGEVYLSFALHRQMHDLKRYDDAWTALSRGCEAMRRQVRYDVADDAQLVDGLLQVCDAQFVSATSDVLQPAAPIFIVGMHRSGTTLLERILAGHSAVGDAGETYSFQAELELAVDRAVPAGPDREFVLAARGVDFDGVARGYARRGAWMSRGKPFFTEKLPHNFLNIGFIAKAMPQARFLHLVRDPMDTCFSNLRQLFSNVARYSYDQKELAAYYLLYRRTMEHWRQVMPGRVLDISYDGLIEDPQATARIVADHCGFDYEPSMIDVERGSGTISTPSATMARQGFLRDRGKVWRHYEPFLAPLLTALEPAYAPGRSP